MKKSYLITLIAVICLVTVIGGVKFLSSNSNQMSNTSKVEEVSKEVNTTEKIHDESKETSTSETATDSKKDNQSDDITKTLFEALKLKEISIDSGKNLTKDQKTYWQDFFKYKEQFEKQDEKNHVPKSLSKKLDELTATKPYVGDLNRRWYDFGVGMKKDDMIVAVAQILYDHKDRNNLAAKDAYYVTLKQKPDGNCEILNIELKYDQEGNIFRMYDNDKSITS